jgi:hypothetical protein
MVIQYFKIYHNGYIRFLMAQKIVQYGAGFLGALPYHWGLSRASVQVPGLTLAHRSVLPSRTGVRYRKALAVGPRESTSCLGVYLLSNRRDWAPGMIDDHLGASGGSHDRVDARPFGGQRGGYNWKYPGEVEKRTSFAPCTSIRRSPRVRYHRQLRCG